MFDYNKFITNQIGDFNSDLTVAATLFTLVSSGFSYIIPMFVGMWNDFNVTHYGYVSIWDKTELVDMAVTYYNFLWGLLVLLGVWCVLNWFQMICVMVDEGRNNV